MRRVLLHLLLSMKKLFCFFILLTVICIKAKAAYELEVNVNQNFSVVANLPSTNADVTWSWAGNNEYLKFVDEKKTSTTRSAEFKALKKNTSGVNIHALITWKDNKGNTNTEWKDWIIYIGGKDKGNIRLSTDKVNFKVGNWSQEIIVYEFTNSNLKWSIEDESIAEVEIITSDNIAGKAKLYGKKPGNTLLTVKGDDGSLSQCLVTVDPLSINDTFETTSVIENQRINYFFKVTNIEKNTCELIYNKSYHNSTLNTFYINEKALEYDIEGIGDDALKGCNFKKISISAPLKYIGNYAFKDCVNLETFEVPSTCIQILLDAFHGCNSLKKIFVSDIDSWLNLDFSNERSNPLYNHGNLFIDGKEIRNVIIPENREFIHRFAFAGCQNLESIKIPKSIKEIKYHSFYDCPNLKKVEIEDLEEWCKIDFMRDANPLIYAHHLIYNGEEIKNLKIPQNITKIKNFVFDGATELETLEIPESVEEIGEWAFQNCIGLRDVEIPNSVSLIGMSAFEGCKGLTNLEIPNSVSSINSYAFRDCINLKEINIKSIYPPKCGSNIFYNTENPEFIYNQATLIVPAEAYENYIQEEPWSLFKNIEKSGIVEVESIRLNTTIENMNIGDQLQLEAMVLPENASNKTITWSSSNVDIVTVSDTGLVTAISEGSAIVTATIENITASCEVIVLSPIIEAQQIVLNLENVELNKGETVQLEATVLPEDATDKTVNWSSSNEEVAMVSNKGFVIAISEGEAIITAFCGNTSTECVITVLEDAGVESLMANPDSKISVYSTDGVLIKKDCKAEELKSLAKGIYIIVSGKDRYKISI